MTGQEFAYWLQGFFELTEGNKITSKQVKIIKDHLALVFTKVTPDHAQDLSTAKGPTLEQIVKDLIKAREHNGLPPGGPHTHPNPNPMLPKDFPFNPFEITCADKSPKIPDSRPECLKIPDCTKDEVYC